MGEYTKPVVAVLDEKTEGVFAASGSADAEETKRCRFGFTQANPNRDQCQACSASNGAVSSLPEGQNYVKEYTECPDGMPLKS